MDHPRPDDSLIGTKLPEPDVDEIEEASADSVTTPTGKKGVPPDYEIVEITAIEATKYKTIEEIVYSISTETRQRQLSEYDDAQAAAQEDRDVPLQPDGYSEDSREAFEPPTKTDCGNCHGGGDVSRTCPDCGGSGSYSCDVAECRSGTIVHEAECTLCADKDKRNKGCANCSNGYRVVNKEVCPNCEGRGRIECTRNHAELRKTCSDCAGEGEVVRQTVHIHKLEVRNPDQSTVVGADPDDFNSDLTWFPDPETVFEVGANADKRPPSGVQDAAPELFDVEEVAAITDSQNVATDGGQREAVVGKRIGAYLPGTVSATLEVGGSSKRTKAVGYYDSYGYDWHVNRNYSIETTSDYLGEIKGNVLDGAVFGVLGYIPVFITALIIWVAAVALAGSNSPDWLLWQVSSVPWLLFPSSIAMKIERENQYFELTRPRIVSVFLSGMTAAGIMTLIHHVVSRLVNISTPDARWYAASLAVGAAIAVVTVLWELVSDSDL